MMLTKLCQGGPQTMARPLIQLVNLFPVGSGLCEASPPDGLAVAAGRGAEGRERRSPDRRRPGGDAFSFLLPRSIANQPFRYKRGQKNSTFGLAH
jgi:hypothetical protein